jgi:ABC-2 type transport system permease protein
MLATLVRFELRLLSRERGFVGLCALTAALVSVGVAGGLRFSRSQQAALERARAEERVKLVGDRMEAEAILSGAKTPPRGWWNNPGDVRGFAYYRMAAYAIKPPTPLSVLTVGQGDLLPYYFRLNAGARSDLMASYEVENPRRLLLGHFDLAFVLVFFAPLALLAVAYDALAGEAETGRLPLLLAHGVTKDLLALVRLGVRAGLLGAVALAALLATLALGRFGFGTPGALRSLAEWLALAGAYFAFWTALALLAVSFRRSSAFTALVLAAAWLVLVVLLPWLINLSAATLHPLPSRTSYVLALRAANELVEPEAKRYELLARYLGDHPELAPAGGASPAMHYTAANIAATREVEARLRPVQARFDEQLARQQALVDRFQWLSPAVLAQQGFVEVAGAGWARHRWFLQLAEAYSDALRAYFNPLVLSGTFEFRAFDDWPRFAWREPAAEASGAVRSALAGLLLPAAAMLVLAIARLRRPGWQD